MILLNHMVCGETAVRGPWRGPESREEFMKTLLLATVAVAGLGMTVQAADLTVCVS